jgi:hypothetical protein
LTHTDPDVEVLLFSHLYPHGRGHFVPGERDDKHRLIVRYKDVRRKLASVNHSCRDDPYWAGWQYQVIEQLRIFQNEQRLIQNSEFQIQGGGVLTNVLLKPSAYGPQKISNEQISRCIPSCVRTGESRSKKKRHLTNAIISKPHSNFSFNLRLYKFDVYRCFSYPKTRFCQHIHKPRHKADKGIASTQYFQKSCDITRAPLPLM